jgi:hypothetical protein
MPNAMIDETQRKREDFHSAEQPYAVTRELLPSNKSLGSFLYKWIVANIAMPLMTSMIMFRQYSRGRVVEDPLSTRISPGISFSVTQTSNTLLNGQKKLQPLLIVRSTSLLHAAFPVPFRCEKKLPALAKYPSASFEDRGQLPIERTRPILPVKAS